MSQPHSFTVKDEHYLSALGLLRLVRLRHGLRMLWWAALVGLVGWIAMFAWMVSQPDDSAVVQWASSETGFIVLVGGFFLLLLLFLAGLLSLPILRVTRGEAGRAAAALVPPFQRGAEITVHTNPKSLTGLLPRLRRKPLLPAGLTVLALLLIFVTGWSAVGGWSVYEANQGEGGTTITIGQDAELTRVVPYENDEHTSYHYMVSSPVGEVRANGDSRPQNGQRYLAAHDPFGQPVAYLIGGDDYLSFVVLGLFSLAFGVAFLLGVIFHARTELRARRAAGPAPLADSVRALQAGARPVVAIGPVRVTLGLPPGQVRAGR